MQWDMTITKAKLERFVELRNASRFNSGFHFAADASAAGFDSEDLGPPEITDDASGWYWETPHGQLIEHGNGRVQLIPRGASA